MSDIGEQTAPAETTQTSEAPASIDNAALLSRMDELAGDIKNLREAPSPQYQGGLDEQLSSQQPEVESASDEYSDDDYYQPQPGQQGYDPYGAQPDPAQAQQQAMAELQNFISSQVQQGVQAQVQPWIHQQQVAALEAKYADLNKPEVVGPLVQEAKRFAAELGQPNLATSPALIEKLYLAQQASQRAAQETPADGDQEVHLEGAGGAGQAAGASDDDLVSRVLNAGGADASARAFWT